MSIIWGAPGKKVRVTVISDKPLTKQEKRELLVLGARCQRITSCEITDSIRSLGKFSPQEKTE